MVTIILVTILKCRISRFQFSSPGFSYCLENRFLYMKFSYLWIECYINTTNTKLFFFWFVGQLPIYFVPLYRQASNMYGRDQQLVQLLVQEPPLSPQHLEAPMVSSRSVNIKWQHKSGDQNEVYKFIVEYREESSKHYCIDNKNPTFILVLRNIM